MDGEDVLMTEQNRDDEDMLRLFDPLHTQKKQNRQAKVKGELDLTFAMDCTGSMGPYILQARQNVRKIVEEIVSTEQADIRLALIGYRDHPPEDTSFVTKIHDFTHSDAKMKGWLDQFSADGGGDLPEAVADALEEVRGLSWRPNATKICVFIADAPPHGLGVSGDRFPNGCPLGLDPIKVTRKIAQRGIKIYMVGCEPEIDPYRDFFMAVCRITGGQYVPLRSASLLAKVITGGAKEELSLQKLMDQVNTEVIAEAEAQQGLLDMEMLAAKVHAKLEATGAMTKQLQMNSASIPSPTDKAKQYSECDCLSDVKNDWAASNPCVGSSPFFSFSRAAPAFWGLGGTCPTAAPPPSAEALSSDLLSTDTSMLGPDPFAASSSWMMPGATPAMAGGFSTTDGGLVDYGVEERKIDMGQAQRMVQSSVMTSGLQDRIMKSS